MRYSAFVALNAALAIVLFLILAVVVLLALPGPAGVGVTGALGLMLLAGFGLSVAWTHRAVTEFGGAPFPGIWGVLGFDIEPDDDPPLDPGGRGASNLSSTRGSSVASDPYPAAGSPGSETAVANGSTPVLRRGCPRCGAITDGVGSRFCRMCGSAFTP